MFAYRVDICQHGAMTQPVTMIKPKKTAAATAAKKSQPPRKSGPVPAAAKKPKKAADLRKVRTLGARYLRADAAMTEIRSALALECAQLHQDGMSYRELAEVTPYSPEGVRKAINTTK